MPVNHPLAKESSSQASNVETLVNSCGKSKMSPDFPSPRPPCPHPLSLLLGSLQKIQRLHQSLLVDSSMRQLMSRAEFRFCKGYADILGKHFSACVLQRLPESLRDMTKDNMISKPPLDNHVFVKVVEDLGEAIDIESEAVQMEKDETFVVRYR